MGADLEFIQHRLSPRMSLLLLSTTFRTYAAPAISTYSLSIKVVLVAHLYKARISIKPALVAYGSGSRDHTFTALARPSPVAVGHFSYLYSHIKKSTLPIDINHYLPVGPAMNDAMEIMLIDVATPYVPPSRGTLLLIDLLIFIAYEGC